MKHSRHNIAAPSSLARLAFAGTFVVTASVAVALEPHIATQAQDRPSPLAACLLYAGEATLLLDGQKVELCDGATAPPTAPVDCFRAATGTLFLSDPQSIALCNRAVSTAPVECMRRVRRAGTVADPQAVLQCVGAR
jgi:hypothetical protein